VMDHDLRLMLSRSPGRMRKLLRKVSGMVPPCVGHAGTFPAHTGYPETAPMCLPSASVCQLPSRGAVLPFSGSSGSVESAAAPLGRHALVACGVQG
jgi:hypothetical protein